MLWRRVQWTPAANSDETDSEFDGALTPSELSDEDDGSEYVGSEYGGDALVEERRSSSRIRAPGPPSSTNFSVSLPWHKCDLKLVLMFAVQVGQNVWFSLKGAWYLGKIKQLVIDPSSKVIISHNLVSFSYRS